MFGTILTYILCQILYAIGQFSIVVNGQILKDNLAIWSPAHKTTNSTDHSKNPLALPSHFSSTILNFFGTIYAQETVATKLCVRNESLSPLFSILINSRLR